MGSTRVLVNGTPLTNEQAVCCVELTVIRADVKSLTIVYVFTIQACQIRPTQQSTTGSTSWFPPEPLRSHSIVLPSALTRGCLEPSCGNTFFFRNLSLNVLHPVTPLLYFLKISKCSSICQRSSYHGRRYWYTNYPFHLSMKRIMVQIYWSTIVYSKHKQSFWSGVAIGINWKNHLRLLMSL